MCESGVGRSSPATRQNAGSLVTESVDPGTTNVPRVTGAADVMTVFSSLRSAIWSHDVRAAALTSLDRAPAKPTRANAPTVMSEVFIRPPKVTTVQAP
jgi:hypothetical protein